MKDLIIILLIVVALVVPGCKKKNNAPVFGPYTMQSVFSSMAEAPLAITMNANSGGSFSGNSGARYIFPPFSLERDSVSVNGNVQVQVTEFLKKSDMIFSGVLPCTNDSPLISGGAFYINITQNGNPVILARPLQYQVLIPQSSTPPEGMRLFLGMPGNVVATNLVNWQLNTDTGTGNITIDGDSLVVTSDSVHYNCAGMYLSSPGYQTFSLKVTAPITTFSDTIMAYAVYDSLNTVWQMAASHDHIITETMVPNYPVHFVVFTVIDGYFYGGILAETPITGGNYTIYLTQITPGEFKEQIDAL